MVLQILLDISQTEVSPKHASSRDELQVKAVSVFQLLGRLLAHQKVVTMFFLQTKWEETSLHNFLTTAGLPQLYDLLSNQGETLAKMAENPYATSGRLGALGIDSQTTQRLMGQLQSQTAATPALSISQRWSSGVVLGRALAAALEDVFRDLHQHKSGPKTDIGAALQRLVALSKWFNCLLALANSSSSSVLTIVIGILSF